MITQILRKSAILLAIYVLLIVGIFVAQFKNDSIISEKFGTLHISLLAANPNDTKLLKNHIIISQIGNKMCHFVIFFFIYRTITIFFCNFANYI